MARFKLHVRHIPAPGAASGLAGPALCGQWAHYRTGDHEHIRRAYLNPLNREGACKRCVARFTIAQPAPVPA